MPSPKQRVLTDLEVAGLATIAGTVSIQGIVVETAGSVTNDVLQFRNGKYSPQTVSSTGVDLPTSIALNWWMGN